MRRQKSRARNHERTIHVIAGIAGGLVASFAMERFQRALGQITPQSEPSTYEAADILSRSVTGAPMARENKPVAASAIHYAFGGAVGAIYGAAAVENPDITAWGGVPFGASVWLMADEMGMPLVGLANPPSEHPFEDHAATFASHLVFGVTTEAVRRLVLTILRSR